MKISPEMPSQRNRVYIDSESDAPDDAIIRESDDGNKYYCPADRGRNNHVGGNKDNELLEQDQSDLASKSFEGPDGQGPFEDFDDCVSHMDDEVDDPEGWCAWAHEQDTGEWPGEKHADNEQHMSDQDHDSDSTGAKMYISSPDAAPDNATIKEDEHGYYVLFPKLETWEEARAFYPGEVEEELDEETDVEMPEAEMPDDGGVESEEEADEDREEIRDESEEEYDIDKARIYIDDPSEAPEGADVEEGPHGGYFYETETGSDVQSPSETGGEYNTPYGPVEFGGDVPDSAKDTMAESVEQTIEEYPPDVLSERIGIEEIADETAAMDHAFEQGAQAFDETMGDEFWEQLAQEYGDNEADHLYQEALSQYAGMVEQEGRMLWEEMATGGAPTEPDPFR